MVADFTGDGRQDILCASYYQGIVQLFSGRPNDRLPSADIETVVPDPEVPDSELGGMTPFSVAVGNLDAEGEGHEAQLGDEILTANAGENSVTLLRNQGNGSVLRELIPTGTKPVDVLVQALGPDGDPFRDIVVVNKDSHNLTLAWNSTTPYDPSNLGTLATTAESYPTAAKAADIDGDGLLDLVLAQGLAPPAPSGTWGVAVHFQIAPGEPEYLPPPALPFTSAYVYDIRQTLGETYPQPVDLAIADMDGDATGINSDNDVVVANKLSGDLRILRNNGGARTDPNLLQLAWVSPRLAQDLRGLTLGDFDPFDHTHYQNVDVVPQSRVWFVRPFPRGNRLFDGMDHQPVAVMDIAAISELEDMAFVLLNKTSDSGPLAFTAARRFPVGDAPQSIVAKDIISENVRDFTVLETTPPAPLLTGVLDLVIANRKSNDISILVGRGMDRALFDSFHRVAVGKSPRDVTFAKMRWFDPPNYSSLDIVTSNHGDGTVTVLQGNGFDDTSAVLTRRPTEYAAHVDASLANRFTMALATGRFGAASGARPDVMSISVDTVLNHVDKWQVYLSAANGSLAPGASGELPDSSFVPNEAVASRFDQPLGSSQDVTTWWRADRLPFDDRLDVAISTMRQPPSQAQPNEGETERGAGTVEILRHGASSGQFSLDPHAVGFGACALTAGDFVGNLYHSIAVANAHDHTISLLVNDQGTFQPPIAMASAAAQPSSSGFQPRDVVLTDLNGDGKLDLVVANLDADSVTYFLGKRPGTIGTTWTHYFESPGHDIPGSIVGIAPIALLAEDFNGDGLEDLAVASFKEDRVTILLNATTDPGTVVFVLQPPLPVGRAPVALAYGDVVGPGGVVPQGSSFKDIVVANSLTSSTRPVTMDLFEQIPVLARYSYDGRFVTWFAAVTENVPNTSSPSTPRAYRQRLLVSDREAAKRPVRLLPTTLVNECVFRAGPGPGGVRQIAYVVKEATGESLWTATIQE